MKKSKGILTGALIVMLIMTGCQKKNETEVQTETQAITVVEETETHQTEALEDIPEGMMQSYLTGEIISKEVGEKRPYAVMINNIQEGLPQSGVSQAEMIYEAQVEGGITRLMALFQDVDQVEKIGSIRSARHYYIDFANDNDAIYVHYGQSKFALARMKDENITTISGISSYEKSVFYRSSDRQAPHNVYTTGEMLAKGLEITGLTRDYPQDYTARLQFNREDRPLQGGENAEIVNIPFDSKPYFTYNSEDGLYYRYQYGQPHIDVENDKQLAFKNIIVQYVDEKSISNEDHQDLTVNGSGKGFYITDGKMIEIKWERKNAQDKTRYYDAEGNQIALNPGKSFFEVVPNDKTVTFE